MKLDLLDNPIRATWDLADLDDRMTDADAGIILQRLLDARLFFVTLEKKPLVHPQCHSIVRQLTDVGVQVLLMTDGSRPELAALPLVSDLPVAMLLRVEPFLQDAGVDFTRLQRAVEDIRQSGINPGLSMTPLLGSMSQLVPLLTFSKDLKIPRFKLPNVRIDDNFLQSGSGQILRPANLEELRQSLPDLSSLVADIDLEIHDLFLWEMLAPDSDASRSEYGGCQAGNSLSHICMDGTVFPCVTWPKPLGSLLNQTFEQIWMSEARLAIRREVDGKPEGCSACSDYPLCYGGCRGLADVLAVDKGLDPMCKGPRS